MRKAQNYRATPAYIPTLGSKRAFQQLEQYSRARELSPPKRQHDAGLPLPAPPQVPMIAKIVSTSRRSFFRIPAQCYEEHCFAAGAAKSLETLIVNVNRGEVRQHSDSAVRSVEQQSRRRYVGTMCKQNTDVGKVCFVFVRGGLCNLCKAPKSMRPRPLLAPIRSLWFVTRDLPPISAEMPASVASRRNRRFLVRLLGGVMPGMNHVALVSNHHMFPFLPLLGRQASTSRARDRMQVVYPPSSSSMFVRLLSWTLPVEAQCSEMDRQIVDRRRSNMLCRMILASTAISGRWFLMPTSHEPITTLC